MQPELSLTVIILTFNEALHIRRVVENVKMLTSDVLIVDSYSDDDTCQIARSLGARVVQNPFTNQAQQLSWALGNCDLQSEWIMRLDADEYLTMELITEIRQILPGLDIGITGGILKRQVHFMGKWIRYGGYYPIHLLRLWRSGCAVIEQRWMDEHIFLNRGSAITFRHDFIDENLNNLTWWTSKHNEYATREAIDILRQDDESLAAYNPSENIGHPGQASRKRWYKQNLYLRMPLFFRCFLYFLFRFWLRLGFLDGRKGLVWHFLQGFWYRFLVDAKILQIRYWAKTNHQSVREVIEEKYKFNFH